MNAVFTIKNKGAEPRSDHSHGMTKAASDLNAILDQTGTGRFTVIYSNAVPDQAGTGKSNDADMFT